MSTGPAHDTGERAWRSVAGHLAIAALLAALAGGLLTLHLGEAWWNAAPRPPRAWGAVLVVLAYLGVSAAFMWRRRSPVPAGTGSGTAPLLVAWASQTGFAAALAERSAAALRDGGQDVLLLPLDQVDAARLAGSRRALFVVSTTGEGDPPDHALRFLRQAMHEAPALGHLQYALLALGDREYVDYCAFGRQLDEWLRRQGAQPLFDRVEVDNADQAALRHWQYELGRLGGGDQPDWSAPAYEPWRLLARTHLNPGSQGGPVYDLALVPAQGAIPAWQPGDVAEIGPRHPQSTVQALLDRLQLDGTARVDTDRFGNAGVDSGGDGATLAELLTRSQLPEVGAVHGLDAPALAARLQPLPHREYSIASVPGEGHLRLLVREMTRDDGTPGLGSGWLCRHAALDGTIDLRLRGNPGFHPPAHERPLILVGNGTGIAGLRAHLRARIDAGARRNWLLFGERNADRDLHYRDELAAWQAQGWLTRLDLAFSRDEADRGYVQDRVLAAADTLRAWVADGASILVCGNATGMAPGVDAALAQVLGSDLRDELRIDGRYRRDVY